MYGGATSTTTANSNTLTNHNAACPSYNPNGQNEIENISEHSSDALESEGEEL